MSRNRDTGAYGHLGDNTNLLINGDFQVWQRGTIFNPANAEYTADRWSIFNGSQTVERSNSGPSGITYSAFITEVSGGFAQVRNPVELELAGDEGQFAVGTTWTLSWYAKSNTHTTVTGAHVNWGVGANSQGRADGSTGIPTSGTLSSSWQRFTYTFNIDVLPPNGSVNALLPVIYLNDVSESGISGFITGVKLERGSVATPFEKEPYGDVLLKCQRYYFQQDTNWLAHRDTGATGNSTQRITGYLPTTMRIANQTVTRLNTSDENLTTFPYTDAARRSSISFNYLPQVGASFYGFRMGIAVDAEL